ncbi:MAG: hypothetical protein ACRD1R_06380 [Acidobacteriota bacterium]
MTHERAEALGVDQVEGQLFIAEAMQLLDNCGPQDELPTESARAFFQVGIVTQVV